MNNKLIASIIGVVVGIIICGSVLAPVVDDAAHDVQYSNQMGAYAVLSEPVSESVSIQIKGTTGEIIVNGITYTRGDLLPYNYTAPLVSDTLFISSNVASTSITSLVAYYDGAASHRTTNVTSDIAVSITSSKISVSYGSTSFEVPYSWVAYLDKNGEYCATAVKYNDSTTYKTYFNSLSQVYGAGTTTNDKLYTFHGTEVKAESSELTATVNSHEVGASEDIEYIEYGYNSGDYSVTISGSVEHPSIILAPAHIEGASETISLIAPLILVLPVFIILALLISIVRRQ